MKVICFGDSNTYGYDPRSLFGEAYDADHRWVDLLGAKTGWNVINQGVNGREIPEEPISVPEDTDLFVVMLGTNDLLQFWPPKDAAEKMEAFLGALPLDRQKILLIAPPPMVWGDWVQDDELIGDCLTLAAHYEALSRRLGIRFADAGDWQIPLAFDGVHLTAQGHQLFAQALYRHLTEGEGLCGS